MMSRILPALAALSLFLTACTAEPMEPSDGTYLGQWDIVEYAADDGSLVPPVGASRPTLVVDEQTLHAATGCNALGGSHTNDDSGRWSVVGLSQTLMACDPEAMTQEHLIGEAVGGATRWKSDAATMTLHSGGRVVLQLTKIDTALEGSSWHVGAINNQREPFAGVASAVKGTDPTLSFNTDGSVSGSAGCNEFTATYTTSQGSLEIRSVAVTRDSCSDDRVMSQELTMIAALWKITGYAMAGHSLRLIDEEGSTQMSAYRVRAEETLPQASSDDATSTAIDESPKTLPPGDPVNLALQQPVRAPGSYGSNGPSALVDGDYSRSWNSGGFPPQWIEVELLAPSTIETIQLLTGQSPAGETVHIVFGWERGETMARVLHVFEGPTTDNQWLSHTPDTPWPNVRFIRIETIASPSWVAWFELEAIGWAN